jgi:hypothetical protein
VRRGQGVEHLAEVLEQSHVALAVTHDEPGPGQVLGATPATTPVA